MLKLKNYAKSTLSAGITDTADSFSIQTSDGAKFPDTGSGNTFRGVFWSASFGTPEQDAVREIVECYRASGDTFTISTRGVEGTTAKAWDDNDNFALVLTSGKIEELETAIGNKVDKITGKGLSTNDFDNTASSKLSGIEASADVTDAGNVGSSINGSSPKTSMVDADKIAIIDTEASNILKTLSWAYVKSILKTYFDGIYNVFAWSAVTSNGNLAVNTGTLANKGTLLTLTLPTTCAVGSVIKVAGMNAGLWKIAQSANQYIKFGNQNTTTGATGYLASVLAYDAVELVCIEADKGFTVVSSVGNITIS